MSRTIDIFVSTPKALSNFVYEIEAHLNLKFKLMSDQGEIWYEYQNDLLIVTIGEHTFENDRDMNFESYRFDISIYQKKINIQNQNELQILNFAYLIFNILKSTNIGQLMMVDDLQNKIEEY